MVDYNNEVTIAKPSVDINRVQILERRAYVIESLERYFKKMNHGVRSDSNDFRNKLRSLFWEIQGMLKRRFKSEKYDYETLKKLIMSDKTTIYELVLLWEEINYLLDEIQLTKVDIKFSPSSPRERAIKYNQEKEER